MQRRVLVTGASKGIGQATAIMLAKNDFNITVHYQADKDGATTTLEQIKANGGQADLLSFDIGNRDGCNKIISENIAQQGPFYGIVNNAGVCRDVPFPGMEAEDWDVVIHTDLDGFYNVLKPCVMPMIQARSGGRIVTMASVSGLIGNRGQVNYSAAKAGIIGASKALAVELAKRKITVNCVAPGLIDTNMISNMEYDLDEVVKHIPTRRVGRVEEVASLINYLMSDLAAYITRQVISVNGGLI